MDIAILVLAIIATIIVIVTFVLQNKLIRRIRDFLDIHGNRITAHVDAEIDNINYQVSSTSSEEDEINSDNELEIKVAGTDIDQNIDSQTSDYTSSDIL